MTVYELSQPDRELFRDAVHDAQKLIDRVWHVTKAVLCNSAPEGSTEAEASEGASDANVGLDQPSSHETALAMRVADDDGKQPFMQPQEESNAGPKHQVILSYSWRGMKEASALLGVLVSASLTQPPPRGQEGASQRLNLPGRTSGVRSTAFKTSKLSDSVSISGSLKSAIEALQHHLSCLLQRSFSYRSKSSG